MRWSYPVLFGVETLGAAIFFWYAVPLYQALIADPAAHQARPAALVWSFAANGLIQAGFWARHRLRPPLPRPAHPLLGHVVLFLARMSFVLASSVFGFVFLQDSPGFDMPPSRYALTLLSLFSLFCYTLEVERLGRAWIGPDSRPDGQRAQP